MRIDYEYLNEFLNVFLNASTSAIDVEQFSDHMKSDSEKFLFHAFILHDRGLFTGTGSDRSIGIERSPAGEVDYINVGWRLTADGHDFATELAAGLTAPEGNTLLARLRNASLDTARAVLSKLAVDTVSGMLGG